MRIPGFVAHPERAVQFAITGTLAAGFLILAWTSSSHNWLRLLFGAVPFFVIPGIIDQLGDVEPGRYEPFVVYFVSQVFIMIAALNVPITTVDVIALISGILAVEAFWAVCRYPGVRRAHDPVLRRVRVGVRIGFLMALGFSLLALVIAAWYHPDRRLFIEAVLGTVAGAAASGALIGLLSPLSQWPLGTMLIGAFAGPIGLVTLMFAVCGVEGAPLTAQLMWVSVGFGAALGPAFALSVKYTPFGGRLRAA